MKQLSHSINLPCSYFWCYQTNLKLTCCLMSGVQYQAILPFKEKVVTNSDYCVFSGSGKETSGHTQCWFQFYFRSDLGTPICLEGGCEAASAAAKSHHSCPTLCDPIDVSLPGSSVLGILQARILEWVVISFSSAWKWKVKVKSLSCIWLFMTLWTVAHQAPLSMAFSRQEYWSGSGLPLPAPHYFT